jgi:hypothetical protein
MIIWLGIVLGVMTIAGTWFFAPSADYAGLLGYFLPPDPSETEPNCAEDRKSLGAQSHLTDYRLQVIFRVEEEPDVPLDQLSN